MADGEMLPDRRELRASHDDRDRVVERLRVAAGDGRLTAQELDERLETALTARTYGELEVLLRDLPAESAAATVTPTAPVKDLVRLQATSGNLERGGPWAVPRRLEVETTSGNVLIDLTTAAISHPELDLAISVRSGNVRLVVPPDVMVDVDAVSVRSGSIRHRVHPDPALPRRLTVTMSGSVRSGNVVIRGPRRGLWARLLRRPPK
ncbi:DUF1707 domain-containing protein [Streptomyces sp. ICBB 8177]|uniref:DUF1707 SHOCT-like domain-containing protein n=1 Tax=Streptomyces sp. ICBB 8177 TaxID=563922 RepID=UPI000D67B426|nr:DUF1707 domain-containing protein [Streptomyces sp. ICBB 8177]PWI45839.1 hypothetical protein CK485_01375 [Streptomyces sp. ICBB 8177]